jgi:hypothetical protein
MGGDKWKGAAAALTLFAVNAWIAAWLFRTPYTIQMGSIEAAFIGLARYIGAHFGDLNWFPLWYGGIPFPDSYPPLLHVVVAAVMALGRISPGLAYHAVVATVYALGPVALYWAARRLGAGRAAAFACCLLYSLLSPTCWLVSEVRAGSGGWFGPRRLITLVAYGEGPHLTSLLFLAVALGALHLALARRRPLDTVAAAMALACVALSNWIGAFALAVAVVCYLLAGWGGPWIPRWLRAAAIGCYAYALAAPWVTPSTIKTIRTNAPKLVGWKFTPPEAALVGVLVAGVLLLAWVLRRWGIAPRVRFAAMFLWSMAVITLGAEWLRIRLLPQAERYHLEMDLAFWLAVTLAAEPVAARLKEASWFRVRKVAWVALAAACIPVIAHQRHLARHLEKPIEITSTAEYRISHWLGEHMPGRRVFAPGSVAFWMNAFSDTPMLVGGFDNGIRNRLLWDVIYQIWAGEKLENTAAWLEALGCDAIVGGDSGTGEVFHPYDYPAKLHGLPELWRDGAEAIYAVPRGRKSLAHALRPSDLLKGAPPAYDVRPLEPFLAALEDRSLPEAEFRWRGAGAASISANLRPEHLLYAQIAWDEGWRASVDGAPRKTWPDALGQMVVEPRCDGPCTVEVLWDGGAEMRVARVVCPVALVAGIIWILLGELVGRRMASQRDQDNSRTITSIRR